MSDTVRKWFYPTEEQWDRWEQEMEERGFETPNQFVQAMVEAGLKKFDASSLEPDEPAEELREERNELKEQTEVLRDHYRSLEETLERTDRAVVHRYLHRNADAEYENVLAHVRETAPERVTRYMEEYEGGGNTLPKDHDPRDDL